jgi:hypothetical protein
MVAVLGGQGGAGQASGSRSQIPPSLQGVGKTIVPLVQKSPSVHQANGSRHRVTMRFGGESSCSRVDRIVV